MAQKPVQQPAFEHGDVTQGGLGTDYALLAIGVGAALLALIYLILI